MALSVDERLELLRTLSYARASSHASIDTLGNSGLVAFLQVQDTLRTIGSRASTVSAIDVLLPMLLSLFVDKAAMPLVQQGGRALLSRVANSRIAVGRFVSDVPGVQATTTTRLYAGVQRRFTFSTYADVLASHRLEQAVLRHGDNGIGGLLSSVAPGEVTRILTTTPARPPTPPGVSAAVSIVDSALSHAVHQRYITDLLFAEVEEWVRLDTSQDRAYLDGLVKELTALHAPFTVGGAQVALDQLRTTFSHFFEELTWSAVFFGDSPTGRLKMAGTTNTPRIVYFDDSGKDVALTRYLLRRFARDRAYYSETSSKDFHVASQRNLMVERFRVLATQLRARKSDFAGSTSILEVT